MIKGQARVGRGEYVSGDYFRGVAVRPAAGRLLGPGDDRVGAPPVVVVSLAFSERHFGGADRAPGRAIQINGVPFTIAGVTPSDFFGVDPSAAPDFYLPLHTNLLVDASGLNGVTNDQYLAEDYYWLEMMARLRPGVSREEAQAALTPVFHRWATTTAHKAEELTSLPELRLVNGATGIDTLRREYSKPLYLLLMLVALILALACANTANLLLARSSARSREMAVRLSIGAGRFRVIRQLLTESLVLALLGGTLGVILAARAAVDECGSRAGHVADCDRARPAGDCGPLRADSLQPVLGVSGLQRPGRAAVRRQRTPGRPPGSRDSHVLREPAPGAVRDSWRAVGHALSSLDHLSRHSTADYGG
jgi:hypothetical protein